MRNSNSLLCLMAISLVAIWGCSREGSRGPGSAGTATTAEIAPEADAEVTAAIAELPEADRAVATAQRFCAVEPGNLLGSMGAPYKVVIDGQSVFLCCQGCEEIALAEPQKTVASAKRLAEANSPITSTRKQKR